MILRQITHDDLGCASYLVGDDSAGVAAIVDPRLEIDVYLDLARYMNVQIEHILETHNHADHVSGHGRLAAATGATIHVHRLAAAQYEHEPLEDGSELELGSVVVRALHTPGHRPEHTAFVLTERRRGAQPWAVLSGDSLFVGDIARPDLAIDPERGARGIFHSLHEGLLALPDSCELWPGHLGGSMCGGPGMDMKACSTIGYERRHNPMLAEPDEERFVRNATARLGPQPPNFEAIVALNRGPLLVSGTDLRPLTPRQTELKRAQGALLVDVRTDSQFDEAHVPGAVSITMLNAGFGTRLAWIADRRQELVLIGRDDEDAHAAARLATAVGIRRIGGYLQGGMTSWHEQRRAVEQTERLVAAELAVRAADDPQLQILDVRERGEWEAGHIPGSTNVPYHDLTTFPAELDGQLPIAVICASGQRAAVAASLLARQGAAHVIHVTGGGVGTLLRGDYPAQRAEPVDEPA